ncbi:hypothetical protein [Pseudoalteromonas sp. 1_2015MBL_MicDiv]|uniref:hypothetical protein n=1 Tax=Pseudoalteromonas sp. 1_2015MBL_MicDiv TaxID=1720343 RepID=UPI000BBE6FBB|nr:hypothetical protein [Pseudoalteromonas sp. 1_2015MBL_MicDiv]ATG79864.1 hypothetical protein AOR04_20210 [Pseudoalteromonas sp. 1_2015MBL_MicDiv]
MYELSASRSELIPEAELLDFYEELKASKFAVSEKERRNTPYASLDWLIPTAFGLYILKPYFDEFLKEAGKDHYKILKKAISEKIVPKFLQKDASLKIRRVTSGGVYKENYFSGSFSISSSIFYVDKNIELKLLFPDNSSNEYCALAIDAFSNLLSMYSDQDLGDLIQKHSKLPIMTSCFWYNMESSKIELLDTIESSKNNKVISNLVS